ncbi:MAG: hypothetical protein ACTSVU_03455 [Promethearchaeota archaeon]
MKEILKQKKFYDGEKIDRMKFIQLLAQDRKQMIVLLNENSSPVSELIHPLIYSKDRKHFPNMQAIPMDYKDSRNLYRMFKKLQRK